jgi:hypothetical protein
MLQLLFLDIGELDKKKFQVDSIFLNNFNGFIILPKNLKWISY